MKLRMFAVLALVASAACANEAAQGDRNTGTANENGTPLVDQAPPVPAVTVDTATTTTQQASGGEAEAAQSTQATAAVDSAAASHTATDSAAHP